VLSRNKARTRLPTLVDSQIVSTETFADGGNSSARAERETRAAPSLDRELRYARISEEREREREMKIERKRERERERSMPRENLASRKSFQATAERRPADVKRR
jgi:hypothetical protein